MSRYLVEQTAARLRRRAAEAAVEGEQFPTESELVDELEVSRTTVREAISRLEAQGVLKRQHGTATSINSVALELVERLDPGDIGTRLAALGREVSSEILDMSPVLLDGVVAGFLRVGESDPARRVRRRWMVDREPVALETEYFVFPTWPMAVEPPDADIFDLSEQIYGETILWRIDTTDATAAGADDAELLDVEAGSPILTGDGVFVTTTSRRVAHVHTVQKPGVLGITEVTTFPDRAGHR